MNMISVITKGRSGGESKIASSGNSRHESRTDLGSGTMCGCDSDTLSHARPTSQAFTTSCILHASILLLFQLMTDFEVSIFKILKIR
jgi:hypothetical protein